MSGVGKKTAERIVLELSEKVRDLALVPEGAVTVPPAAQEAVSALVSLGFSFTAAESAVREALKEGEDSSTEELIRKALSNR